MRQFHPVYFAYYSLTSISVCINKEMPTKIGKNKEKTFHDSDRPTTQYDEKF